MITSVLERGQRAKNVIGQRKNGWATTKIFTHGLAQGIFGLNQQVNDLLNTLYTHLGADSAFCDKGLVLHVQQLANAYGRIRLGHFVSLIFLVKAMSGRSHAQT